MICGNKKPTDKRESKISLASRIVKIERKVRLPIPSSLHIVEFFEMTFSKHSSHRLPPRENIHRPGSDSRGSVRVRTPPVGGIGSGVRVSASFQIFALRMMLCIPRGGLPPGRDFLYGIINSWHRRYLAVRGK